MQESTYAPHEFAKVVECAFTVSGLVFITLQGDNGRLNIGTTLSGEDGQKWEITDNNLENTMKWESKLQAKIKAENLYMCLLEPIGRLAKPFIGETLSASRKESDTIE